MCARLWNELNGLTRGVDLGLVGVPHFKRQTDGNFGGFRLRRIVSSAWA